MQSTKRNVRTKVDKVKPDDEAEARYYAIPFALYEQLATRILADVAAEIGEGWLAEHLDLEAKGFGLDDAKLFSHAIELRQQDLDAIKSSKAK